MYSRGFASGKSFMSLPDGPHDYYIIVVSVVRSWKMGYDKKRSRVTVLQ